MTCGQRPRHRRACRTGTSLTRGPVVYFLIMHPISAQVRAFVAEHDPELLEGIAEVDRTLIRAWLDRDPWERLTDTFEHYDTLQEMAQCLRQNYRR